MPTKRVQRVIELVHELDEASTQLRGWLLPGGFCCPNVPRVHGYCPYRPCVGRREHAAVMWAQKAAHAVHQLAKLTAAHPAQEES